jgi:hypothetical protein
MASRAPLWVITTLLGASATACTNNEPAYLDSPTTLEAGVDNGMGGTTGSASMLTLPVKPESPTDLTARMALATQLGLPMTLVPYVRLGDFDVEVEYSIKNLDSLPGQAKIELNGANEYNRFDPSVIVLSAPGDNEAPKTPGLQGDIPIDVPANGQIDGVFREDQLVEATIDLDAITRGNLNPFKAVLTINKNDPSFDQLAAPTLPTVPGQMLTQSPTPIGPPIPRAAMAQMIEVDLVFTPNRHMVLSYTVRVRDHRGILADKGLDAVGQTCSGDGRGDTWMCAMMFTPVVYMP